MLKTDINNIKNTNSRQNTDNDIKKMIEKWSKDPHLASHNISTCLIFKDYTAADKLIKAAKEKKY